MTAFLLLPKWVLSTIRTQRQQHLPYETGGFLIGERRGPHIDVTGLTQQGRGDVATHTSIERSCLSHREAIHRAWRSSAGTQILVGDWHSHPQGTADASSIDIAAWRTLARLSKRPVIGLIHSGARPHIYFAAEGNWPFATLLTAEEEASDHYAFSMPPKRQHISTRFNLPQTLIR